MLTFKFEYHFTVATLFLLSVCIPVFGLQFSAVMNTDVNGTTTSQMFYFKDGKYRTEGIEAEEKLVIIVDEATGITRILSPEKKQYVEVPVYHPRSLANDPFQAFKHAALLGEQRFVRSERLEGHMCDYYIITVDDQKVMDVWISTTLAFPVKIVTMGEESRTVELTNMLDRPLEDSLFEIPPGYKKIPTEHEERTVQPWYPDVSNSIVRTPPFDRLMFSEDVLRIPVRSDKILKVTVRNQANVPAVFMAAPFLNREPIRDPAEHVLGVEKAGAGINLFFTETEQLANEVTIHAMQGTFTITATYVNLNYRNIMYAGDTLSVPIKPGKDINLSLINLTQQPSVCWLTFFQREKEMGASIIGPLDFRTFTLARNKDVSQRVWTSSLGADRMLLHADQGELLVTVWQ
jgi:hypothetical protein